MLAEYARELAQAVLDPERGTAVYHTQPPASIHDKSAPTAIVTATSSIRRSIIPKDLLERTRGKVHVAESFVEPEVHGRPDALQGEPINVYLMRGDGITAPTHNLTSLRDLPATLEKHLG